MSEVSLSASRNATVKENADDYAYGKLYLAYKMFIIRLLAARHALVLAAALFYLPVRTRSHDISSSLALHIDHKQNVLAYNERV